MRFLAGAVLGGGAVVEARMRLSWISIVAFVFAAIALAGVITLAFAYENLRRQLAGISSDLVRLPSPSAGREHSEVRVAVIRSQLSRVEKPVIVMGDSIVEQALLPVSLCGHPVINAGIGGANDRFLHPLCRNYHRRRRADPLGSGGRHQRCRQGIAA